ncbi:MAG: hypothetical protein RIR39_2516, partial [Pseudomonadota bacterium]
YIPKTIKRVVTKKVKNNLTRIVLSIDARPITNAILLSSTVQKL